jgi:hypothetical protein
MFIAKRMYFITYKEADVVNNMTAGILSSSYNSTGMTLFFIFCSVASRVKSKVR